MGKVSSEQYTSTINNNYLGTFKYVQELESMKLLVKPNEVIRMNDIFNIFF